jgi:hypothetical protein
MTLRFFCCQAACLREVLLSYVVDFNIVTICGDDRWDLDWLLDLLTTLQADQSGRAV